jgi:CRP/FNR family cyclic AMP-dependent transcriptional regulator
VTPAELLATIPIFETLSSAERESLAGDLRVRLLAEGETAFNQGDGGGEMYLVEDGAIDITIGAGATSVVVASLFTGQYFGELTLFDGLLRSATATATKATRLLCLGRDDLVRFISGNPEGAFKILAEMSNRMRKTNELMSSQVSRNVVLEHDEHLTFPDRVADIVASFGGSWAFIGIFVMTIAVWMALNIWVPFDVPGFQLLNLVLAVIAAGQAPIIMMSQNRQETKSKLLAENDYKVNLKNEIGIAGMQRAVAEVLQRTAMIEKRLASLGRAAGVDGAASGPSASPQPPVTATVGSDAK